jgi:hypothetical protein
LATKKIYDLAVKTGEYTNGQGETKGRYLNVGAIMQKDDGGKFIMLERTFNPAGVPNPENRSNLLLSMFPAKEGDGQQQQQSSAQSRPAPAPTGDFDDDIPF